MIVTRVYNNGDRVAHEWSPEEGAKEIAYNAYYRIGVAVFRDAECVQVGYLGEERCAAISEELRVKIEEQRT